MITSSPRILRDHPINNIIGDLNTTISTRKQLNQMSHVAFISNFEPKNYKEASKDDF